MKAVKLVTILMFVLLMSGRQVSAQEAEGNSENNAESTVTLSDTASQESENTVTEVAPYANESEVADAVVNEVVENADVSINEVEATVSNLENETVTTTDAPDEMPAPVETSVKVEAPVKEEAKNLPDQAIVDAVKADIKERRKASGKLDIFDGKTNKVRTLDLIEFKAGSKQDGDNEVVQADFRDTTTGDIVTMDIKVKKDNDVYGVKEMLITNAVAPTTKEVKKDYSDDELKSFMKDYIDTQSQATGTFDLYDEKAKKMRNLEFVSLDDKIRRYGIIAIATAEFKDKTTGDTVKVDVNAENKDGLGITAMRLKGVTKAAPKE